MSIPNSLEALNRESRLNEAVERVVAFAHQELVCGPFTTAEFNLAWLRVMEAMLQSVIIDNMLTVAHGDLATSLQDFKKARTRFVR